MRKPVVDTEKYVVILLAGDRTHSDPVAQDAGVSCKAITSICGKPMILRVIDALQGSGVVKSIVLCGPPQAALQECPSLAERINNDEVKWMENLDSPSRSVEAALDQIDEGDRVLLTTADHALLEAEVVKYFALQSIQNNADATVALVEYRTVRDAYPEVKRTVLKFSNGDFCGCNLFTFMNSRGRKLVPFWRQVEQRRKNPVRMLTGVIGIRAVLMYLLKKLSLDAALSVVSTRLQLEVRPVIMPFPRAGIDVDTVQDRVLVEKILSGQGAE